MYLTLQHANITSGVVATEDQDGAATEAAAFTAGYPVGPHLRSFPGYLKWRSPILES